LIEYIQSKRKIDDQEKADAICEELGIFRQEIRGDNLIGPE